MTPSPTTGTPPGRRPASCLWIGLLGGAIALLGFVGVVALVVLPLRPGNAPIEAEVPESTTARTSAAGLFHVTYSGSVAPIPINKLHTWTLHVENAEGRPVENAVITVEGDMPEHGHGMPTQPQVTQELGNGNYLVEGMKFQMGGRWVIDFIITANGQTDKVSFDLTLQE